MNAHLAALTDGLSKKPKAKLSEIQNTWQVLGVNPPEDYIAFLLESNGAEGFTKGGRYLMLESVERLVPCNEPYGLGISGPGLASFGSDGGAMLFAFDTRESPPLIVEVDSVSMEMGKIILLGRSFTGFLEYLNQPIE
jgi:hypothetical protein